MGRQRGLLREQQSCLDRIPSGCRRRHRLLLEAKRGRGSPPTVRVWFAGRLHIGSKETVTTASALRSM